jgi:hypothetical protein
VALAAVVTFAAIFFIRPVSAPPNVRPLRRPR